MSRSPLFVLLAGVLGCALLLPAPVAQAKGGGGRGGGPGKSGGGQGPNPFSPRTSQPADPKEQARKLREKIELLLSNGFVALKASDTAAALEDFSDVLQLVPDQPLGHLGVGLVRAQEGKFPASQTEFSTAATGLRKAKADAKAKALADAKAKAQAVAKAQTPAGDGAGAAGPGAAGPGAANGAAGANGGPDDPQAEADAAAELDANLRVANYDLAVSYSRSAEVGRAMVLLDRMIGESKPPDEMLVNAQRALLATLDEKKQASIAALPAMNKTLESAYTLLRSAHRPLRRWGVSWMSPEDVSRHRQAREVEPLPKLLPFLMPYDELMPEPLLKLDLAQNPLSPVVAGQEAVAAAGKGAPAPAPTTSPVVPPSTAPAGEAPATVPSTATTPTLAPAGATTNPTAG